MPSSWLPHGKPYEANLLIEQILSFLPVPFLVPPTIPSSSLSVPPLFYLALPIVALTTAPIAVLTVTFIETLVTTLATAVSTIALGITIALALVIAIT